MGAKGAQSITPYHPRARNPYAHDDTQHPHIRNKTIAPRILPIIIPTNAPVESLLCDFCLAILVEGVARGEATVEGVDKTAALAVSVTVINTVETSVLIDAVMPEAGTGLTAVLGLIFVIEVAAKFPLTNTTSTAAYLANGQPPD